MDLIKNIPNNKPWIDYSSLSILMSCPRKYYWRVVREITSTEEKLSLINGQAYHECKAVYYKSLQKGNTWDVAVEDGIKALIPIMKTIKTEDKKRNLTVAVSTMLNYFQFWREEEYETLDVEVRFAVDIVNFILVGRIDRLVKHRAFGKLVEETKTTSIVGDRWSMRTKPNLQLDGYITGVYLSTGERPAGGVLDIIPVTEKLDKKPMRYITVRTESDVEDYIANIQEWWFTLMRYRDTGIYPQNTDQCYPLVGFTCEYATLCNLISHPHKIKELAIPAEYKVEPWMPFSELSNLKDEKEVSKC